MVALINKVYSETSLAADKPESYIGASLLAIATINSDHFTMTLELKEKEMGKSFQFK